MSDEGCKASLENEIPVERRGGGGRYLRYLICMVRCSACGRLHEYVFGSYEYCPRCGKRFERGILDN